MDKQFYPLLIVLALVIMYILYTKHASEGMSPTRERANTLYDWFSGNEDIKYTKYRSDIKNGHNVEYYDVKNLKSSGNLTVNNIMGVIA